MREKMNREQMENILSEALPKAKITVITEDDSHFAVSIESSLFIGKSLLQQHQMIQKPLQAFIESGEVHALSIKTSISKE